MYNIQEIKLQNQQDAWSLLYLTMAGEFHDSFGLEGERMIRDAVKDMGLWIGTKMRKTHASQGVHTNLISLFRYGCGGACDPRVRGKILRETEESRLWEIYICPQASLWGKHGGTHLGSFYCEEYMHALVRAYTEGCGQMHVAKSLTCPRDLHCQFAAYLRPANMSIEQQERSFGENVGKELPPADFQTHLREKTIVMLACFYEQASETFGADGLAAFSRGLRRYQEQIAAVLERHADDVVQLCDRNFLAQNFPIDLHGGQASLWEQLDAQRAEWLVQTLLVNQLKCRLGMNG